MRIVDASTLKFLVRLLEKEGFDFSDSGKGHTVEFVDNCGIIRYPYKNEQFFMAVNNSSFISRYMVFLMDLGKNIPMEKLGIVAAELKHQLECRETTDAMIPSELTGVDCEDVFAKELGIRTISLGRCIFNAGQSLSVWVLQ